MKKNKKVDLVREIDPRTWNKKRLRSLIREQQGRKILVVGDVGVDRYTLGNVERISPEAPVPIVFVQDERLKLGLAANVADNIRALGSTPFLVGVVGHDRGAQDFRHLLKKEKISSSYLVEDSTRRTVLKERVVSDRQQLLRIDYESTHAMTPVIEARVLKQVERLLPKVDAVIIEDYAKGLIGENLASAIFSAARRYGKIVAVDPNTRTSAEVYHGASVLTPNTREAESLSGVKICDEASLVDAGQAILKKTFAKNVVITRGKEGMAIFNQGNDQVSLIPTYAREVYDVSGAGDTVISVMTLALSGGATVEEAAVLGNLAAGVEVGKRGTATVSCAEIEAALEFFATMSVSLP